MAVRRIYILSPQALTRFRCLSTQIHFGPSDGQLEEILDRTLVWSALLVAPQISTVQRHAENKLDLTRFRLVPLLQEKKEKKTAESPHVLTTRREALALCVPKPPFLMTLVSVPAQPVPCAFLL